MTFRQLFLDANAHLPFHPKALQAYTDFHRSIGGHGHPSSPSAPGRAAAEALEKARSKIASLIGAKKAGSIIFTSSCTQACEWGLEILFNMEPNDGPTSQFVVRSAIEHPAVRDAFDTLSQFEESEDVPGPIILRVDSNGVVENSDIIKKVCCIHVHNEIGVIQDLKKYAGKILFSDMSQSLGKIPVDVTDLDVDIAVFGSHKFGGPGGFGFIYLKDTSNWESFGAGSRYFLDRPGTPDVAGAVATAVALEEAISTLEKRAENMKAFQSTLEDGLERFGYEILGKGAPRAPGTTFVKMPGKGLTTVFKLGEAGIHVGLGSACGSMHTGASSVAKALGVSGDVQDFMRISQFGEYTDADAKIVLSKIEKAL